MMKKKKMLPALYMTLCIGLTACQPTPEEEIVVDKSEGLPEGSILEESDAPKDLGAPEVWQETAEDGDVILEADVQINLPEVCNTPVYAFEMAHMTDELLEKLCGYFADGNEIYEEPSLPKARLEQEKALISQREGAWAFYNEDAVQGMCGRIDELLGSAPDEWEKKVISPKLAKPRQTDWEYVQEESGFMSGIYSDYYFDTDEEIGLKARIDRGGALDPCIQVIDHNKDIGSTTNFLFSQGTYVDEKELERKRRNQEVIDFGASYEQYLNWIGEELDKSDEEFSQEDALKKCEEVLEDLSLDDFAVTDCFKAAGNSDNEHFAGPEQSEGITDRGYSVYYSYKAGGLAGYEQPFQRPYNDLPEEIYAPYFSTEQIHMIVTKEGVRRFEWTNISNKKETIAPNTEILAFDDIKERLLDHVSYTALAESGGVDYGDVYFYYVKDVQLRAANTSAFEDSDAVWLVPVWVFELEREITFSGLGTQRSSDMTVVLNAIDGGYIQPKIDPRIPVD